MAKEEKKKASEAVFDFTNTKDQGTGQFNKKRQPEGDYKGEVLSVEDSPSKKDNINQWLYTIKVGAGTYPYYCKHQENQYFKIRNLLIAAGINVPKKRVRVKPEVVVGKFIGVTLEDDEYEGRAQSNIASVFPVSELDSADVDETDDDDDDEDTTPAKAKKAAADDDDDDDEPTPPKKSKKAPPPPSEDDDDDDDEEPAPPPKKKPKPADDDDLEELDIDDV